MPTATIIPRTTPPMRRTEGLFMATPGDVAFLETGSVSRASSLPPRCRGPLLQLIEQWALRERNKGVAGRYERNDTAELARMRQHQLELWRLLHHTRFFDVFNRAERHAFLIRAHSHHKVIAAVEHFIRQSCPPEPGPHEGDACQDQQRHEFERRLLRCAAGQAPGRDRSNSAVERDPNQWNSFLVKKRSYRQAARGRPEIHVRALDECT